MSAMFSGLRRSWWLVACLSMGLATASCANDAAIEDDADGISDLVEPVTDVSHTDVRNQSIGNCWSYASTGWLESLHRARTGQSVNVSESWITFWDWHRKITGTGVTTNATTMRSEVSTSGWWDSAMTILRDRGVVMEAEFIPEEAASARSSRQSEALAAINAELNGEGRLATATARRDPQIVLNVLFDAWRINDDVRAEVRRVYGISARRTLGTTTATPATWMRKATSFPIRTSVARSSTGAPTSWDGYLSDVIPGGRYAWRSVSYPSTASSRVAVQRRVMRALNAAQPVLVSWLVDFNARSGSTGAFELETLRAASGPGRQGGHLVTTEDYEVVVRQPGQTERRLLAGQMASAADMRLAEQYGEMVFLRIKNSWGTSQGPLGGAFGGYHDLYTSYLNGPIRWTEASADRTPLSSVIIPSGF
nr:hypothetical protein [Deltaproteobacteria bacterium]